MHLPHFTANTLNHPAIAHGFFTRLGGVSEGLYATLNVGRGSRDNPAHVAENLSRVQHALHAEHLCTLQQIHSARVITVTEPWTPDARPEADALVTNRPGIALGILTADCVPILFADPEACVIGAAHAGWKGAIGAIAKATIKVMESLGADRKTIHAAIGPAIAQPSYQVDAAFRQTFLADSSDNTRYFITDGARFRFDLKAYVAEQLRALGLASVETLPHDTYPEDELFFSFRRATHRQEADYGRQISAITLI